MLPSCIITRILLLLSVVELSFQVGSVIFKVPRVSLSYYNKNGPKGNTVVGRAGVLVETNVAMQHMWQVKELLPKSLSRTPATMHKSGFKPYAVQRPVSGDRYQMTEFILEVTDTSEYHYVDLCIESADQSLTFLHSLVIKPMHQNITTVQLENRENLTEVVRPLPPVTNVESGEKMNLACSILVPVSEPQYAFVEWTVFHPGLADPETIPKPRSIFFYKYVGGEVKAVSSGDQAYRGEAKAEPFNKVGGRSGAIVSTYLNIAEFNPTDHSGEYSCHLNVDGVVIKMTSVVVPNQVQSLFMPNDVRVQTDLCDGTTHFYSGRTGCVRCTVLGFPVPMVSLRYNHTELDIITSSVHWGRPRDSVIIYHLIEEAAEDNQGVYECTANQGPSGQPQTSALNVTMFEDDATLD